MHILRHIIVFNSFPQNSAIYVIRTSPHASRDSALLHTIHPNVHLFVIEREVSFDFDAFGLRGSVPPNVVLLQSAVRKPDRIVRSDTLDRRINYCWFGVRLRTTTHLVRTFRCQTRWLQKIQVAVCQWNIGADM